MRSLSLIIALVLVVAPLVPAAAVAEEASDQEARSLYLEGARAYDEGRYEDAVAAWRRAYDLSPRPLLLFNMANALERLGRAREALDALTLYRQGADASEHDTLDRRLDSLQRRVDDLQRSEAEGERRRRDLDEAERRAREQEASARRAEEAALAQQQQAAAQRAAALAKAHPLPIILLGVGLGASAGGVVLAGAAFDARQDAGNLCDADTLLCPESARTAVEKDSQLSLGADIVLSAGVGVAAIGLVTSLIDLGVRERNRAPKVGIGVGPRGVGVSVAGVLP